MSYLIVLAGVFSIHVAAMVSPGPNFLIVTQIAIGQSRKAGLMTAFGITVGALVWAGGAIVGLSFLFERFTWLYSGLKFAGGVYLAFIGFKIFLYARKPIGLRQNLGAVARTSWSCFHIGFITNLTNPKSIIFFGSIFAAVISPELPNWVRAAAVGVIVLDALLWHVLLALAFSTQKVQSMYQRAKHWIDWTIGVLLVILGIRLSINVFY